MTFAAAVAIIATWAIACPAILLVGSKGIERIGKNARDIER